MISSDTILALSSAPGPAPRAILRLSGPDAWRLALTQIPPLDSPTSHRAYRVTLAAVPVPALLLLFQAPRSYTGLDIAELHIPGSPALLRTLTDDLLARGARQANPGEFTAQAFFNGKLDLTEAEGIAATIAAQDARQLRAAANLREGHLHRCVQHYADRLAELLARVEAGIDFTDEADVSFIAADDLSDTLVQMADGIHGLLNESIRLDRLDTLPTVVFVGEPNVGKSSLINALVGRDRSIVSPTAGTTRDVLSAVLHTPAGDVRLVDVPGEEPPTADLHARMQQARQAAIADADLVVKVVADPSQVLLLGHWAETSGPVAYILTVQNKADLLPPDLLTAPPDQRRWKGWQLVSAQTGLHLPELRDRLADLLDRTEISAIHRISLTDRHRNLLHQTRDSVYSAAGNAHYRMAQHPELLAADLRHALDLLGQITGLISPDDILGRIFSTFCIGK